MKHFPVIVGSFRTLQFRMSRLSCMASFIALAAAAPSCSAPPGIVNPAVSQSLCYETLVPFNESTGVGIRAYGIGNETLVQWSYAPAFFADTPEGIPPLLSYFSGENVGDRDIRYARTTPILAKGYFQAMGRFLLEVAMAVSPQAFPNASSIPQPTRLALLPLGSHTVAVVQFNTSGFPPQTSSARAAVSNRGRCRLGTPWPIQRTGSLRMQSTQACRRMRRTPRLRRSVSSK